MSQIWNLESANGRSPKRNLTILLTTIFQVSLDYNYQNYTLIFEISG